MDVFLPTQQIIKFYQLAPRISNLQKNVVQHQVVSKPLTALWSSMTPEKIELQMQLIVRAIRQHIPGFEPLTLVDILEGAKSFEFYPYVMNIATKATLKTASEQMKEKSEAGLQEVKALKNLANASQSFVPSVIEALCQYMKVDKVYADHNFGGFAEIKEHMYVAPLKAGPRNVLEEAAAYVLVDDTIESIQKKINKGFCEDKNVAQNPVLEQFKVILLFVPEVQIGGKAYKTIQEITADFEAGTIVPKTLKEGVVEGYKAFWKVDDEIKTLAEALKKK